MSALSVSERCPCLRWRCCRVTSRPSTAKASRSLPIPAPHANTIDAAGPRHRWRACDRDCHPAPTPSPTIRSIIRGAQFAAHTTWPSPPGSSRVGGRIDSLQALRTDPCRPYGRIPAGRKSCRRDPASGAPPSISAPRGRPDHTHGDRHHSHSRTLPPAPRSLRDRRPPGALTDGEPASAIRPEDVAPPQTLAT